MYPGNPVQNLGQPIQGYLYPLPGNQAQMAPTINANPAPLPGYNQGQMPPTNNAYATLPVPAGYESLTTANIDQSSQMKI